MTLTVDRRPVPYDQELAGNVPQKVLQKIGRLRASYRALMESEKELPERDPGDERVVLPVESFLKKGRLPAPSPGAHAGGPGAQPAFVDEDDGSALAPGFFFMAGHL